MDDKGLSHSSVRTYVFGVKKWFKLNGVEVDWDKIEMPTANDIVESDRAPTKEELKNPAGSRLFDPRPPCNLCSF